MSLIRKCRDIKPFQFENDFIKIELCKNNEVLGDRLEVHLKKGNQKEIICSVTQFRSYQNTSSVAFNKKIKDKVNDLLELLSPNAL